MESHLLELYPAAGAAVPLAGLYLKHDLHNRGSGPYVYSDFIVSLDGRIALPDPHTRLQRVPPAIANPRDWRLYLELSAQADVLLTTSRHLRAVAAGRHRDLLAVADESDLREWRLHRGLPPSPRVAAVSLNLDIPERIVDDIPGALTLFAAPGASVSREKQLAARGITIHRLPGDTLDGAAIVSALAAAGHRVIFSIAGPRVLHALCSARRLQRLYLTQANVLLGGEAYTPLMAGPELTPPAHLTLSQCYLDAHAPAGASQLLAVYDVNQVT